MKGEEVSLLKEHTWTQYLAFLVDSIGHLNIMHLTIGERSVDYTHLQYTVCVFKKVD